MTMSEFDLDRTDFKILNFLQRDNRITNQDLADAVALSPPTCLRRVRRLRDSGLIKADVSLIDLGKIGSHLMLVVEIELRDEDREQMDAFERHLIGHPSVMKCFLVAGEVDYIVLLCVKDMKSYEKFVRQSLYANRLVERFRTLTVISQIKDETRIDLPLKP